MKKNLKSLGAITAALTVPVATAVSCGSDNKSEEKNKNVTPTTQPVKTSKEDLTKKANESKPKNLKAIKELFSSARFIEQGNKKVEELAKEINSIKDLEKKIKAISNATNISLWNTKNGTNITDVTLTPKMDGTVAVLISTNTLNASNPKDSIDVTIVGISDNEIDKKLIINKVNETQTKNIADIENKLNAHLIKQGQFKSSEIANKINGISDMTLKLQALKDAAGINLDKNNNGTEITNIILASKPDGSITIIVSTKTQNASTPSKNVFGSIKGKADNALKVASVKPKVNKDELQKTNISNIEKEIQNKTLHNQGNRKVVDIAKEIELIKDLDAKITAINKLTGANLTKENNGTTITQIALTTKTDGSIIVVISTDTPNTTSKASNVTGTIKGMSDAEIDAINLKNAADKAQKTNIDVINNKFTNSKLIKQGNRKASEVVNEINGINDIEDKFKAIEKEIGVKLEKVNNETTITNVILASTPNGEVLILISTDTPGATDSSKDITIKVSSTSDAKVDAKLDNEKADKDILVNEQNIKNSFVDAKIVDQKVKKVQTIVDEVNAITDIDAKLSAIKKLTNVNLPKENNGTIIDDISLVADSKTGEISISIKTITANATNPNKEIKVMVKGKTDATIDSEVALAVANQAQQDNTKTIDGLLKKAKLLNQGNRKVSEIVDGINTIKNLDKKLELIKTEIGIDLPKDQNGTTIKNITLTSMSDGTIAIVVATTTNGASVAEKELTGIIKGQPDAEIITKIANEKQTQNILAINNALKVMKLLNQGTNKTSKIKETINNMNGIDAKLKAIKDMLNVDLNKTIDTTEITDITIASKVDGTISVSIKTNTQNAKTPLNIVESSIKGKSDADIEKELIVPANNFPYDVKTTSKWTKLPKDFDFSRISHIPNGAFKNLKELPENFDFSKVTSIGEEAFEKLTSIPIKKNAFANVKTIGKRAFLGLRQLPNGNMFANVERIEEGAFYVLESLPSNTNFNKLTIIGSGAFHNLKHLPLGIKFPEVKTIGMGAFGMLSSWTEGVEFPKVETIEDGAFYHLKEIPDGLNFSKVTSIGVGAFYSLNALPAKADLNKVKTIGDNAFYNLVALPLGVGFPELESIGNEAFRSLEFMQDKTVFPKLTTIGYKAFMSLVSLPDNVKLSKLTSVGIGAFSKLTALPRYIDLAHLKTIEDGAFFGLLTLPAGINLSNVISLGDGSFGSLTTIPQGVKLKKVDINQLTKAFTKIDKKTLETANR
ncbi:leucine-rich repeat protein [Mycoplasma todarodis]|uniref:leucine-rich repeat protein n=1 Tax=Mycoplasma todarodis TaxID=1937191 RepID=UPI003B2F063A